MEMKTFSRSYLQGLPIIHKRQHFEQWTQTFCSITLIQAAKDGKTSCLFDMTNMVYTPPVTTMYGTHNAQPLARGVNQPFPTDDLIALFKEKYPDCEVSYQEVWVDSNSNTKVLKKGILIDWT